MLVSSTQFQHLIRATFSDEILVYASAGIIADPSLKLTGQLLLIHILNLSPERHEGTLDTQFVLRFEK